MCIWYHGTQDKKTMQKILSGGFKQNTYFTWDLNAALNMGGKYIFEVYFPEKTEHDYWEFVCPEPIPTDKIMRLRCFEEVQDIMRNDREIQLAHQHSLITSVNEENIIFCEHCKGKGQLNPGPPPMYLRQIEDKDKYAKWPCHICEKCNGKGYIKVQ